MKRLRALLITIVMIGGVASIAGNAGTFASFSAEATNANTTFATGSIVLSDKVNSGTACLSSAGALNNNANCSAILTGANLAPGGAASANLTIQNTGTLNASKLYLWAPSGCTDSQVTNLGFNPITNNPLCSTIVMFIQETGATPWCWYGLGSGTASCDQTTGTGNSHLDADTTHTLKTFTTDYTSSTDTGRSFSDGATTSGSATLTSSTANFTSADLGRSVSGSGIPLSTTILAVNSATSVTLSSNATATATGVSITLGASHRIDLLPVNGSGPFSGTALASGGTRTFTVGLYLPNPTGSNQNALQALQSTWSLTWHIDQ